MGALTIRQVYRWPDAGGTWCVRLDSLRRGLVGVRVAWHADGESCASGRHRPTDVLEQRGPGECGRCLERRPAYTPRSFRLTEPPWCLDCIAETTLLWLSEPDEAPGAA
jgi:hypothetical protein